jgi:hypothetical protein
MGIAADRAGSQNADCFSHTLHPAVEDGLKLPQVV